MTNHWRDPNWHYHNADTHQDPALFRERMKAYRPREVVTPMEFSAFPQRYRIVCGEPSYLAGSGGGGTPHAKQTRP